MAEADTLTYYNKLAQIRSAQPLSSAVAYNAKQCSGFITGDAIYTYRCPGAWLEYSGQPNASTVQLVFPRDYYGWVKSYLRQALPLRPGPAASAEFRVVWALDVWAHVNYALFALPLPWSDIFGEGVSGVPELALAVPIFGGGPKSLTADNAAVTAWSNEKAAIASTSATKSIKDSAAASRLNPTPFAELAVRWCRAPGSRSQSFQKANPLWPLLLAAVQPWNTSWSNNWLLSRGNKDAGDIKRWSADPVLLRAAMQWRLWSAQDWGYIGPYDGFVDPTYWPYGMGKADACATLSAYIASVKGEHSAPKITFRGTQAYPNLGFGLESVAYYASAIINTDFDTVMQTHLNDWLQRSAPRLDANGVLAQGTRQPATRTDYADYFKGLRKALTDRTRAAVANPALACEGDKACLDAAKYGAKVQAAVQSSPLAPVQNAMQKVADKLATWIGAAVGGGWEPLFVLRDPFSRMFAADGYRLAADGSTADVMFRIALAIENYKGLVPGLFSGQVAQVNRVQLASCRVHWTRSQLACEICEGAPTPSCASDVPGFVMPQAALTTPLSEVYREGCDQAWQRELRKSPYARKIDGDASAMMTYRLLCIQRFSSQITEAQYQAAWGKYLQNRFGSSLLLALVGGFLRSSNPLR